VTAALATAGVAALALSVMPVPADAQESAATTNGGGSVTWNLKAAEIPGQRQPVGDGPQISLETDIQAVQAEQDKEEAQPQARAGAQAQDREREGAGKPEAERAERAAERAAERQPVSRGAAEQPRRSAEQATTPTYPDTLDGWIREALAVMADHGIPGTYDGLYRNIIRESSGDPNAINLWDINAQNGTPSIGLLQVIQPTFDAYHVPGTPFDVYDPVANLTAAANYAADRYGSIDNVFGAY
jgi:hypothetical protein